MLIQSLEFIYLFNIVKPLRYFKLIKKFKKNKVIKSFNRVHVYQQRTHIST